MVHEDILKEQSDLAIERGNKFQGFLGEPPESFSKEQLIMICNVLSDRIEELRTDINNIYATSIRNI